MGKSLEGVFQERLTHMPQPETDLMPMQRKQSSIHVSLAIQTASFLVGAPFMISYIVRDDRVHPITRPWCICAASSFLPWWCLA